MSMFHSVVRCVHVNIVFMKTSHSHVRFFFKVDSNFSVVECTWTLRKVVVGKSCLQSPIQANPSLYSWKWHTWHFYMPSDIFIITMFYVTQLLTSWPKCTQMTLGINILKNIFLLYILNCKRATLAIIVLNNIFPLHTNMQNYHLKNPNVLHEMS